MIPNELIQILESDSFKKTGHVELSNLSNLRGHTLIEFKILGIRLKKQLRRWNIEIINLYSSSMSKQLFNSLEVCDDHFLLKEAIDLKATLYIKQASSEPFLNQVELQDYFSKKYADEIDIYRYLSKGYNLSEILRQSHCKFGDFPYCMVYDILDILEKYECEPYIYQGDKLAHRQIINNPPLKLLRLGNSIFIAQHFEFYISPSFVEILFKTLKSLVKKFRQLMGYN